jgi:ferredoxin-NADP reductase
VSPYLTTDLAIGDVVELRGPIGGWFVWRDDQTGPIQLIAGGSGIVPLMSMIRSRAAARSAAPFRLLYSVRTPASVWYRNELLALSSGVGITYVYTRAAPANWPRPPGRIDATVVADASWPAIVSRHATSAARHRSSSTSLIFSLPRATVPSGSELSGLDPREIAHNTIEERVL